MFSVGGQEGEVVFDRGGGDEGVGQVEPGLLSVILHIDKRPVKSGDFPDQPCLLSEPGLKSHARK